MVAESLLHVINCFLNLILKRNLVNRIIDSCRWSSHHDEVRQVDGYGINLKSCILLVLLCHLKIIRQFFKLVVQFFLCQENIVLIEILLVQGIIVRFALILEQIFSFNDEIDLESVLRGFLNSHDVSICLVYYCDDEVHKYDVADNGEGKPQHPCCFLHWSCLVAVEREVTDWSSKCHHQISERSRTLIARLAFGDKNLDETTESSNHQKKEDEEGC